MQRKIPESKHSYIGERLENVCVVISGQRLSRRLSLKMCIAQRKRPSFESLAYRPLLYGLSGGGGVRQIIIPIKSHIYQIVLILLIFYTSLVLTSAR